jgi:hypothetical protein
MRRRSSSRFARELAACALVLAWVGSCSAKSAVVCDKLEGCGLLRGSAEDCVETIRKGFADEGVDGEKLTKCIDCFGVKYCDEIERGLCEEDCGEVLRELRRRGILEDGDRDGGEGGAGGEAGAGRAD